MEVPPHPAFYKLGARVSPTLWYLFGDSDLMLDQYLKGKSLIRSLERVFPVDQSEDTVRDYVYVNPSIQCTVLVLPLKWVEIPRFMT